MALVSAVVALVGGVVALVRGPFAFLGQAFTFISDPLTFISEAFTFVGDAFAFVGMGFALIGTGFALVGVPVALVDDSLVFFGTEGSQFGEAAMGLGGSLAQVLDSSFLGHFGSESVVVGVALLVGGSFALVGGLFAFGGVAVAVIGVAVVFVGHALAVVGDPFALIGLAVALVVDVVALVGGPFTLVRGLVPFVSLAVALVRDLVAFFGGAHSFGAFDESQVLEPATGLGRETAKVRHPAPFLGGAFAFVGGAASFDCGPNAPHSGFTSVRREEFASFRRSLAQPRGERACLGGALPEFHSDPLHPRHLARFVLPTVCGGHVTDSTRPRQVALAGVSAPPDLPPEGVGRAMVGPLASGSGGP